MEATLSYEASGKSIAFNSTDVPPQFQGKGVGKLLADVSNMYLLYLHYYFMTHRIILSTPTSSSFLIEILGCPFYSSMFLISFIHFLQYAFSHAQDKKLDVIVKCHFLAKYYESNLNKYRNLKVKIQLD